MSKSWVDADGWEIVETTDAELQAAIEPARGWIGVVMVECPACGQQGNYWEDRVTVHGSVAGFEIREAGIDHPDGRVCTEW